MMDAAALEKFAVRSQTPALNVAREYCQHLFLSAFYQHRASSHVLFKGGTALRIIYGSPRFSEDLDFSGFHIRKPMLEELIEQALSATEQTGIAVEIEEAKTTSGGYLSIVHERFLGHHVRIQLEISLRGGAGPKPETTLITNDLVPAYTLAHLPQSLLVQEKMQALLTRSKPRDFYDLYFILRRGLLPHTERGVLKQVLTRLKSVRPESLKELKLFLPRDQQGLVKDFRATLERELQRYVGRPHP